MLKMLGYSFLKTKCVLTAVLLTCSVKAIEFRCVFTINVPATGYEERYSCIPTVINRTESSSLENVTGNHLPEKSNDDVQGLWISTQKLPFLPGGIADFFKNLDALTIQVSSLMSISANDLRPFPRLVILYLHQNKLTSLDGDLFKYTPQLKYVYLHYNQILHIGHDLVTNLNSLTRLFFQQNICIDRYAETRSAVILLGAQLSVLCPPLNVTTTTLRTTTTGNIDDKCLCEEEIEELRVLNQQHNRDNEHQNREIERLTQQNAAFEKRLLEVEMKLLEIGSMPCSNWIFGKIKKNNFFLNFGY